MRNGNGALSGAVIAVAGAGGPAGRRRCSGWPRRARPGGFGQRPRAPRGSGGSARYAHGGATVIGDTVDLLDLKSTRDWASHIEKDFGHVDGLVHLVGGWRGTRPSPRPASTTGTSWTCCSSVPCSTRPSPSSTPSSAATGPIRPDQPRGATKPPRATPRTPRPRPPPRPGRSPWPTPSARRGCRGTDIGGWDPCGEGAGARRDARRPPQREVRGLHGRRGPGRGHRRSLGEARRRSERKPSGSPRRREPSQDRRASPPRPGGPRFRERQLPGAHRRCSPPCPWPTAGTRSRTGRTTTRRTSRGSSAVTSVRRQRPSRSSTAPVRTSSPSRRSPTAGVR